jgi:CHAT domain-containing protein/Tfp pilus assembly protein PilF
MTLTTFASRLLPASLLLLLHFHAAHALALAQSTNGRDVKAQAGGSAAQAGPQEQVSPELQRLFKRAQELYNAGQYDNALPLLEQMVEVATRTYGPGHPYVADSLFSLGEVYKKKGDYARAVSLLERALAIREQALGRDHAHVATTLHSLAELYRQQGDYQRSRQTFERALAIREQAFGREHPTVADTLNSFGGLLRVTQDLRYAEQCYSRALKITEANEGPQSMFAAIISDNLGMVYADMGDLDRAELAHLRALKTFQTLLGPENLDVAKAINNLASLYMDKGDDVRGEQMYKESLRITAKVMGEEHYETAIVRDSLAAVYQMRGNYDAAEEMHRSALASVEKEYGADHPFVAEFVNNLAHFYSSTGDYVRAEKLYRRALAIREKRLGPTDGALVPSLNDLAAVLEDKGDYVEATLTYRRAVDIGLRARNANPLQVADALHRLAGMDEKLGYEAEAGKLKKLALEIQARVYGPDDPKLLGEYGVFYARQGDFVNAEKYLGAAVAKQTELHGREHPVVVDVMSALAMVYLIQGKYAQAEPLFLSRLEVDERQLGPDHPKVGNMLFMLSVMHWMRGDAAQSVRLLTRATDIFERKLAQILTTGSDRQKSNFMMTTTPQTYAAVTLNVFSAPNSAEATRLALTTILRRKGRAADAITDQIGTLRRRLDPQDRALFDEWNVAQSRYAAYINRGAGRIEPAQFRAQAHRLEGEVERLEAQISSRSAEFRAQAAPITVEAVQRAIPAGAALVEMASYEFYNAKHKYNEELYGAERYVAYVLRREGDPVLVDLGEAAPVDRAGARLRAALSDPARADVKQAARAFDEMVMRPVRKVLGETRAVFLSPDGELSLVPFEALVDERGRYLVEDYTFTYLTSGRDLLRLEAPTREWQPPLVVADPDCDLAITSGVEGVPAAAADRGGRPIDFGAAKIAPLPGTAREAAAIKDILPGARVLTGREATEEALKRVAGPRILHVATHGFFFNEKLPARPPVRARELVLDEPPPAALDTNPLLRSGLVLAGVKKGQSGAGEDGVLTALEAAGLDLWGTKLVVLSACETGVGEVASGEGVYGLRRALVLAGAESQLMSLWKVSDAATKDLMIDYYWRLQAGEGRASALRAAQLDMLAGSRGGEAAKHGPSAGKTAAYSHPFYWASFIPVGDWRSLDRASRPSAETPRPATNPKPSEGSHTPDVKRPAPSKQAAGMYDAAAWVRLGQAYFGATPPDYDRAIDAYRRALTLNPRYEEAWQGIAAAALRKGSLLVARDAINQLAVLNPSNPSLPGLRAQLERLLSPASPVRKP